MSQIRFPRNALFFLILSFILLFTVSLMRIIGGILLDSPVLNIEGYHAFIDTVISFFIVFTIFIVRSSLSEKFPYGLYKLEDLTAIILSLIILFTLFTSIDEIFHK
ncbi:MAG: cation transporter, partial [Crenarchaeota archaeon]|nr:cation transporter [Thermoproteota archaeon]